MPPPLEPSSTRPRDDAVPRSLVVAAAIALRVLVVAAGVALVAWAAWRLLLVVVPVVVALLLATLMAPAARQLERLGLRPSASASLVLVGAVLVIAGVFALLIPALAGEVDEVRESIQAGVQEIGGWLTTGPLNLSADAVDRTVDSVVGELQGSGGQIATRAVSGATVAAEVLAAVLLTLVLAFFFVKDGAGIWAWLVGLWNPRHQPHVRALGDRAWRVLSAYFRGVAFVATVDAVLIGAGLFIVGVPLALPLMVLTFLAAFFPIVGSVLAGAAAVLVALVTNGPGTALVVFGLIVLVQQVEGNVLYPMVVGRSLRLHPVATLLALSVGAVIGGVAGAFLSIPVAAVLASVLAYAREERSRAGPELVIGARVTPTVSEPISGVRTGGT